MKQNGGADLQTQNRRRNEESDHAETETEILPNDAAGLPAQSNGEGGVV